MRKTIGLICISASVWLGTAHASLLRFQQGVWNGTNSGAVAYNVQDANTSSAGTGADSPLIVRRFGSGYFTSVFRFDLTEAALTGAAVTNVTLTLRVSSTGTAAGTPGGTYDLRALPAGNTNWLETTATGAEQSSGVPWKLANGSNAADSWNGAIFGTLLGTKTFASNPADGEFVVFNLDAAVVNQWLANPATYAGFAILQPNNDAFSLAFFDSSESATASFRPLLEMTLVPEPSTMLLIGLGSLLLWRVRRSK